MKASICVPPLSARLMPSLLQGVSMPDALLLTLLIFVRSTLPNGIVTAPAMSMGEAQTQSSQMRFASMDTNGDGVISRAEWRGSAQSFRVHDWNQDGVLSGDEVRVGRDRSGDWPNSDFNTESSNWFDSW